MKAMDEYKSLTSSGDSMRDLRTSSETPTPSSSPAVNRKSLLAPRTRRRFFFTKN